jgi:leucyl-tRNA synthetase
MGYGTGAVMAVPAHDERDFAFAKKFSLPIIPVYDPHFKELSEKFPKDPHFARTEILEGNRCWEGEGKSIHSSHKDFSIEDLDVEMAKTKIIAFLEKENMGEKTINYKLRDWLFSRQRYWGEPIPILHFPDGTKRILGLDELPLLPPVLDDYKPSGTGESPIAKVESWVHVVDTKTGKVAKRETNTMPQWAGSCWYYLRFCDPQNTGAAFSSEAEKYWMPVDLYVGGAEHAVLHLLYSRFWHKVLYDCGIVHTNEPFQTYRYQGIVTAPSYKIPGKGYVSPDDIVERQGKFFIKNSQEEVECLLEKMSKSKLNGVTPDEMQEEFGADALRLYEMFMGPFDREKIWNSDAVSGCSRFLHRLYDIVFSDKVSEENSEEAFKMGHRLVDQVTRDIETMQFNTAIPHMMEFVNEFSKLPFYPKSVIQMVAIVLSPFAPHLAEEIWEYLGGKPSIAYVPWPKVDKKYLVEDKCLYIVQINGKVRGKYELPMNQGEAEVISFVSKQPQIEKYLTKDIVKTIFVPNKLVNIVMAE